MTRNVEPNTWKADSRKSSLKIKLRIPKCAMKTIAKRPSKKIGTKALITVG